MRASAWLAELVRRERLPQKLLMVHQFTAGMVRDKARITKRPGPVMTFHVDGFGHQTDKTVKYWLFTTGDKRLHNSLMLRLQRGHRT